MEAALKLVKAIFNDGSERLYRPHADRKPTDRIREEGAYIDCACGDKLFFKGASGLKRQRRSRTNHIPMVPF